MNRAKSHTQSDSGSGGERYVHNVHAVQLIIRSSLSLERVYARALCHCHIDLAMWTHKRIELSKSSDIIVKFHIDANGSAWFGIFVRFGIWNSFSSSPTNKQTHVHPTERTKKIIIIWLIMCTLYTSFHFALQTKHFWTARCGCSLFPDMAVERPIIYAVLKSCKNVVQFWLPHA